MGLLPDEQQALTQIENHFAKTNPTLATWLAILHIDSSPAREHSPSAQPKRQWRELLPVLIALVAALAVGITVVVLTL